MWFKRKNLEAPLGYDSIAVSEENPLPVRAATGDDINPVPVTGMGGGGGGEGGGGGGDTVVTYVIPEEEITIASPAISETSVHLLRTGNVCQLTFRLTSLSDRGDDQDYWNPSGFAAVFSLPTGFQPAQGQFLYSVLPDGLSAVEFTLALMRLQGEGTPYTGILQYRFKGTPNNMSYALEVPSITYITEDPAL